MGTICYAKRTFGKVNSRRKSKITCSRTFNWLRFGTRKLIPKSKTNWRWLATMVSGKLLLSDWFIYVCSVRSSLKWTVQEDESVWSYMILRHPGWLKWSCTFAQGRPLLTWLRQAFERSLDRLFDSLFRELCLQYLCQYMPLGGRQEHQHFLHLFFCCFGWIKLLAYQHMSQGVVS